MADSPYTPEDFEALVVSESDTVCTGLKKLLKFSVMSYIWLKWFHGTIDGTGLSDTVKAWICRIECPDRDAGGATSENPPT